MQDASEPASNAGLSASSLAQTMAVLVVDQEKLGETVTQLSALAGLQAKPHHHSESRRILFNPLGYVAALPPFGKNMHDRENIDMY